MTNSTPYPLNSSNSSNDKHHQVLHRSQSYTPTPHNVSYEEIRIPTRSSSREINLRNTYSNTVVNHQQTIPRPSSSQSQYQDHQRSVSRASNYTPNPSSYPPNTHQIRTIETYQYNNTPAENGNANGNYQDGRESVRSPLTLSMDSGISSSGIVNSKFNIITHILYSKLSKIIKYFNISGRIQGSSVSPSSFPSQASPQGM